MATKFIIQKDVWSSSKQWHYLSLHRYSDLLDSEEKIYATDAFLVDNHAVLGPQSQKAASESVLGFSTVSHVELMMSLAAALHLDQLWCLLRALEAATTQFGNYYGCCAPNISSEPSVCQ